MIPNLTTILEHAVVDTVTRVCGMHAQPISQISSPTHAVASVAFRGPVTGVLQLRADVELMPMRSARMVPELATDATQLQEDCLGELTSIICGVLFPMLAPGRAFQHSPPRVCTDTACIKLDARMPIARARMRIRESNVVCVLYFDDAA
jgi:hypothetical protein